MTRRIVRCSTAALVVVALLGGTAASARPIDVARRTGPCALTRLVDETVRHLSKRVIDCAATRWTVPGGTARAVCIAKHESGLLPTAASPGKNYLGLFQHSAAYWPSRYADWTRPIWALRTSALNGRSNAIVAIRMAHASGGWRAAGWRVPGC